MDKNRRFCIKGLGSLFALTATSVLVPSRLLAQSDHAVDSQEQGFISSHYLDLSPVQGRVVTPVCPTDGLRPTRLDAIIDPVKGRIIGDLDTNMMDYPVDPASLTKILSYMVILDCLKAEKTLTGEEFSFDTKLVDIVLVNGEKHIHSNINVDEGLKFLMGRSKNRIASSFAQLIAGSEEAFVGVINNKARQLGLKNSRFINASGLPGHDLANTVHGLKGFSNVSTLEDLSILTIQTSRLYPEYTKYTGRSYKVGDYEFTSVNPLYRKPYRDIAAKYGLNGLKTGTTDNGRSLIATGKLNNHELSIITLGHLHVDENDELVKEKTRPEMAIKLFAENERLLSLEDYEIKKKIAPKELLLQRLS